MTNYDPFKEFAKTSKKSSKELNQKFNDLTFDIQEIMQLGKNPAFLSMLLFKLAEERRRTNELLESINIKYDKILKKLKDKSHDISFESNDKIRILPEQDQLIINLIQEKGTINADEVKQALKYKGKNAASQRLNKLAREDYLKKVQSGRRVLFTLNQ